MLNPALSKLNDVRSDRRLLAFLAIVVILALVASAALTAATGTADATAAASVPSMPEAMSFEYFPSAYVNHAAPAEEHIQAF